MRIHIRIWIRIRKSVVQIWVSVSVPKCHRSTTLALGMLIRILSRIRSRIRICLKLVKRTVLAQDGGRNSPGPGQMLFAIQQKRNTNPTLECKRENKLGLNNTEDRLCQVAIKTSLATRCIYPLRLSTIISCYHFSAAKLNLTTELNSATPG